MNIDRQKLDDFLGRVVSDLAAGHAGVMVSLGHRLGLYEAMAGGGPLGSHEIARRADCAERYVREWLNSQAAGGYVVYHPSSETYELTPEQAVVLADADSPTFIPPALEVTASMWLDQEKAVNAFRTGAGVPWDEHDDRLFRGSAAFYRNAYRGQLVQEWLPSLDGVTEKLEAGARVLDVGCGHGHSTIIMAEAFPGSRYQGFDAHPGSIAAARRNAREAGVGDCVEFEVSDATGYAAKEADLICFFDCLHDMGDPIAAARHAAASLSDDGTVLVVEPWAGDRVEENLNPVGRLYYAASTMLCTAHALSEGGGLALGAQAGEARLTDVLRKAGLSRVRLAHRTPFNLILEARR